MRVDVEDEAAHVLLLLEIHPAHRLIEQEEIRLHGERAAELHPLLQTVGQFADLDLADMLDLEKVDDLFDAPALLDLFRERRAIRISCQKNPRRIFSVRPAMMLSSALMPLNSATF